MRVVLISPGSPASLEYQPPLGLAYLLAYLKENGLPDVHFLDHQHLSERAVGAELARLAPDLVGINCVTPTRKRSVALAKLAKEVRPQAAVVLGGIHATFLARQLLETHPEIDYIVCGEGEQTALDLVRSVEGQGDPAAVQGLAFRRDGQVVETPRRDWIADLDGLPFPEYIEHYSRQEGGGRKAGAMITSRGCGGACNYCSVTRFWGRPRLRSPGNVVDEMERLVRDHGVGYIRMMDDTFTVDMDRAAAVCEEILRRNLRVQWRCTTRADCFSLDLARLLKRAGCTRVSLGAESGSPAILKTIHKNVTPRETLDACRWAREAGLILEVCFMVGNLGESRETIEETKALARKIRPDEFCVSSAVYLFPGTPLFRHAARRGLIDDSAWLKDDPVFPYTAEHTLEELSAWQMELIRECAASKGLYQYLRYALRVAARMPPKALLRAGWSFLKANLPAAKPRKPAPAAPRKPTTHG
jgi:radical SAM superfamily enzyme YgiQ (UPF0313 family)